MTLLDKINADITGDNVFYDIEAGFAETITTSGGSFRGIFDNDYQQIDADGFIPVSGSNPIIWCRSIDEPLLGDTVTVRSVSYTVIEVQPNNDSETLLILRES